VTAYTTIQDPAFAGFPSDTQGQQPLLVSQRALASTEVYRRPSSVSPSAQMRQPPGRDRTPIQHHRTSVTRARSHSRSEMLLAYAAEQGQITQPPTQPSMTVVPSQSAPTTPQIFSLQSYSIQQGAGEGYSDRSSYFPVAMPPTSSPQLPDFPYQQNNPEYHGYYPIGRSAQHSAVTGISTLNPQETLYMPPHGQQLTQSLPSIQTFPPIPTPLESTPGELEIMSSRPKPQCWDHGCNGRQFSTFSNLLRHQREKSGSAMKAMCPHCGTEFTRTTARNGHMYGGKCKGRGDREASESSSVNGKDRT
jgi:hypothetical protein